MIKNKLKSYAIYIAFRFPNDDEKNKQWRDALEINVDHRVSGTVCIEHFRETDFKRRDEYHVILKPDAIPSLQAIPDIVNSEMHTRGIGVIAIDECSRMDPETSCNKSSGCKRCKEYVSEMQRMQLNYEFSIQKHKVKEEGMEKKIKDLRKRLRKANINAYYLQTVKKKLCQTINELKKANLLNEEDKKALEVNFRRFCCNSHLDYLIFFSISLFTMHIYVGIARQRIAANSVQRYRKR